MEKDWNSNLYLKFKKERTLPAIQLLKSIDYFEANRILDVGCGPGNSTKILKDNWPKAHIIGIDSSPNMIENARENLPELEWILKDINDDLSSLGSFDVIFSNAVIQWLPDHDKLIEKLFNLLNINGVLAIQIPYVLDMDIKKATDKVAMSDKWGKYIKELWKFNMYTPDFYYNILCNFTNKINIWESTYYHIMNDHTEIINWYKATGMRPYFQELPDEDSIEEFVNDVLKIVENSYPKEKNGKVLFPFRRVFLAAYK